MNTQDILQFIETSRKKLEALTKPCWICGKDTNAWVPIFPENGEMEGLGFGKPTEGRTRIAWAPICITHDVTNHEIRQQVVSKLVLKRMTMTN